MSTAEYRIFIFKLIYLLHFYVLLVFQQFITVINMVTIPIKKQIQKRSPNRHDQSQTLVETNRLDDFFGVGSKQIEFVRHSRFDIHVERKVKLHDFLNDSIF